MSMDATWESSKTESMEYLMSSDEPWNIVLIGHAGNGKSSTGNTILGRKEFKSKPTLHGRHTCTSQVQFATSTMPTGQLIKVIDTPADLFDDGVKDQNNSEDIAKLIDFSKDGIHAILLVLSVNGEFSKEEEMTIQLLHQVFGPKIDNYVIVAFTGVDVLENDGDSLDDFVARGFPQPLQEYLNACGNRHVFLDNKTENEDKKTKQLQKLCDLIQGVIESNGMKPFTNEFFQELKHFQQGQDKDGMVTNETTNEQNLTIVAEKIRMKLKDSSQQQLKQPLYNNEVERLGLTTTQPQSIVGMSTDLVGDMSMDATSESLRSETMEYSMTTKEPWNVVLLGPIGSGKSSIGNTILRRKVFKAKPTLYEGVNHSSKIQNAQSIMPTTGHVINVIDTPGLFGAGVKDKYNCEDIAKCISLCEGGIHAILLVLSVNGEFSTKDHQIITHVLHQAFGPNIAEYVIVAFTGVDMLEFDGDTILDFLARGFPKPLQDCLNACHNRYAFFDNKTKNEDEKEKQLHKLSDLIHGVVQKNDSKSFTNDLFQEFNHFHKRLNEEEELRLIEKVRLKLNGGSQRGNVQPLSSDQVQILEATTTQSQSLDSAVTKVSQSSSTESMEYSMSNEPWTVVLFGRAGNGKSSTGNTILGRKQFKPKGPLSDFTSTTEIESATLPNGRVINVVDMPGLFGVGVNDEYNCKDIAKCINFCKDGIHAILLVLSVSRRFSKEEEMTIQVLHQVFGRNIINHVIVAFTGADMIQDDGDTLSDFVDRGFPEPLQKYLNDCNNRLVFFDNKTTVDGKKTEQLEHLSNSINDVLKQCGSRPFTNELFEEFKHIQQEQHDQTLNRVTETIKRRVKEDVTKPNTGARVPQQSVILEAEAAFTTQADKLVDMSSSSSSLVLDGKSIDGTSLKYTPKLSLSQSKESYCRQERGSGRSKETRTIVMVGRNAKAKQFIESCIVGNKNPIKPWFTIPATTIQKATFNMPNKLDIQLIHTPGLLHVHGMSSEFVSNFYVSVKDGIHVIVLVFSIDKPLSEEEKSDIKSLQHFFGDDIIHHIIIVMTCSGLSTNNHNLRQEAVDHWAPDWLKKILADCESDRFVVFDDNERNISRKKEQHQSMMQKNLQELIDKIIHQTRGKPFINKMIEQCKMTQELVESHNDIESSQQCWQISFPKIFRY